MQQASLSHLGAAHRSCVKFSASLLTSPRSCSRHVKFSASFLRSPRSCSRWCVKFSARFIISPRSWSKCCVIMSATWHFKSPLDRGAVQCCVKLISSLLIPPRSCSKKCVEFLKASLCLLGDKELHHVFAGLLHHLDLTQVYNWHLHFEGRVKWNCIVLIGLNLNSFCN